MLKNGVMMSITSKSFSHIVRSACAFRLKPQVEVRKVVSLYGSVERYNVPKGHRIEFEGCRIKISSLD